MTIDQQITIVLAVLSLLLAVDVCWDSIRVLTSDWTDKTPVVEKWFMFCLSVGVIIISAGILT